MAEHATSCAHCGKQGCGFKRCSVCKEASYCGAACQKANWKRHKKTCAPPVPLGDVVDNMNAAHAADDWRGVLKWEGRMEELMAHHSDTSSEQVLACFSEAHEQGWKATGSHDHARSLNRLQERRIPLLGNLQRFRDQGEALCSKAHVLYFLGRSVEGKSSFQRARDVGAAHGFFSIECNACIGLGAMAMNVEGRHDEGVALLRNALVAAELNELDDPVFEMDALASLIPVLFKTDAIDEVEPLVLRYRELAKAQSEEKFCYTALSSLCATAHLHEARGRPEEAAGEVRALLEVMRENETAMLKIPASCEDVLKVASSCLKVLDPEVGEEELIQAVADQQAKVLRMVELNQLHPGVPSWRTGGGVGWV